MRSKADETLVIVETLICPLQKIVFEKFVVVGFCEKTAAFFYDSK